MTREKILRIALEMSQHNLYCYSQDFACTLAKKGQETNYTESKEQVEILKVWLYINAALWSHNKSGSSLFKTLDRLKNV